ncbi:ABC transporter ATP-binding protein [Marinobacterium rhizophilum]|uniref:ATP-binding cassette domain-containing protein n=1 Tax=Marinobacterium rhizophilum TaxID=420402 RepID=A0ABY5HMU7_9GAMM|nr:ABC transporter ATP-binding protein [Marinobacterium rhizophilum]UTW13434.1 ATP-binding cassette domain-containing protein [Marinobacterium rhizophilum]
MTIAVQGLGFNYGARVALADLSFELQPGSFNALLGPNGAGKSTLFGLLTRLLALQQGDIQLFGLPLRRHAGAVMRRLGVVFQQGSLDMDLSVAQNLAYHGALQGLGQREIRHRMHAELERLELGDRLHERVRNLNGGHRRRVEIARALLHRPAVLLLDEATVGLDTQTRAALNHYVRRLCNEDGLTVLWATHLIEEIDATDRVLLLHQGRLRADNSAAGLCEATGTTSLGQAFALLTRSSPELAP